MFQLIKQYFSHTTSKGIDSDKQRILEDNETFSYRCLDNSDIMARGNNEMITDDKRLANLLNEHYINIVERSSDLKPEKIVRHKEDFGKRIVSNNIKKYENHSSINMSVKSHLSSNNTLASARRVTSDEVNLILKSLNTKKASGTDKIPTKLVKLASNFLSKPLATAIKFSSFLT